MTRIVVACHGNMSRNRLIYLFWSVAECRHHNGQMIQPRSKTDKSGDSGSYSLEDSTLAGPPLPGEVIVRTSVEKLIDLLAAEIVAQARLCVRQFGTFHLALSGGSTPIPLYERLMYDPNCRSLPWEHTHIWIVDERCVPLDDERSNYQMINETIGIHSGMPPEQVHSIAALSQSAEVDYEALLRELLSQREAGEDRLDFILLGMGTDGHTASLFPGHDAINERVKLVRKIEDSNVDPPQRITMTFPLINSAREIAVLVTGKGKAPMIERIASGHESMDELPIKGVIPTNGCLKWYLDAGACGHAQ